MNKILLIMCLTMLTLSSNAQPSHDRLAYATPNKDTLYVVDGLYLSIFEIWQFPEYINDSPIIIKVDSAELLANIINARREDEN
jgi:hypothetical protein